MTAIIPSTITWNTAAGYRAAASQNTGGPPGVTGGVPEVIQKITDRLEQIIIPALANHGLLIDDLQTSGGGGGATITIGSDAGKGAASDHPAGFAYYASDVGGGRLYVGTGAFNTWITIADGIMAKATSTTTAYNASFATAGLTVDASTTSQVIIPSLTGNVIVNNPTNGTTGQWLTFMFTQDGTGGRTVTYGGAFINEPSVNLTAAQTSSATFRFNGIGWVAIGGSSSGGGGGSSTRDPIIEGVNLTDFSNSEEFSQRQDTAASGFGSEASIPINRVADRLGMQASIRAVGGSSLAFIAATAVGGGYTSRWRHGLDRGIIVIDGGLVCDTGRYGDAGGAIDPNPSKAVPAWQNTMRGLFRWLAADPTKIFPVTGGTGSWLPVNDVGCYQHRCIVSSTSGDFTDVTFNSTELCCMIERLNIDQGSSGHIEFVYNASDPTNPAGGSVIRNIDGGNGFPVNPFNGLFYQPINYYHHVEVFTAADGIVGGAGQVMRIRKPASPVGGVAIGPSFARWTQRPLILFVIEGHDNPLNSLAGIDTTTTWTTYQNAARTVLAESEFSSYCFGVELPDWDPVAMTDSHTPFIHRNDEGGAYVADQLEAAIVAHMPTTYTQGIHNL